MSICKSFCDLEMALLKSKFETSFKLQIIFIQRSDMNHACFAQSSTPTRLLKRSNAETQMDKRQQNLVLF